MVRDHEPATKDKVRGIVISSLAPGGSRISRRTRRYTV
jgi:hypothetical protein